MKTVIVVGVLAALLAGGAWTGNPFRESPVVVTRVIDGDTVVISGGERVRLIGIDAPELGECGAEEATESLRERVEGQVVSLPNPDSVDDTDRYGRLLRYVEAAGHDSGYGLIAAGLVEAGYDSQDGFQWHPREERYRSFSDDNDTVCEERDLQAARDEADDAGVYFREDDDPDHIRRLVTVAWVAAKRRAKRAGTKPRKNETLPHLDRRVKRLWAPTKEKAALLGLSKRRGETLADLQDRTRLEEAQQRQEQMAQQNQRQTWSGGPAGAHRGDRADAGPGVDGDVVYGEPELSGPEYDPGVPERPMPADLVGGLAETPEPAGLGYASDDQSLVGSGAATGGSSYTGLRCYAPGGSTYTPC